MGVQHKDPERFLKAAKFFFEYLVNTRYHKYLYNHLRDEQKLTEQEEQSIVDNFNYIQR